MVFKDWPNFEGEPTPQPVSAGDGSEPAGPEASDLVKSAAIVHGDMGLPEFAGPVDARHRSRPTGVMCEVCQHRFNFFARDPQILRAG